MDAESHRLRSWLGGRSSPTLALRPWRPGDAAGSQAWPPSLGWKQRLSPPGAKMKVPTAPATGAARGLNPGGAQRGDRGRMAGERSGHQSTSERDRGHDPGDRPRLTQCPGVQSCEPPGGAQTGRRGLGTPHNYRGGAGRGGDGSRPPPGWAVPGASG